MLVIDRILYYLGATRIFHQLESNSLTVTAQKKICAPPAASSCVSHTVTCSTSTCSLLGKTDVSKNCSTSSINKYSSAKSKSSVKQLTVPKTLSFRSKSTPTVPACSPRPRTTRVDFAHPVVDNRLTSGEQSISTCLKQSLLSCSVACRRLKGKLSGKDKNYVWTRMVHSEKGSKVYEVYQKSNPKKPTIVFLVLPNGHVMPFETLSANVK